MIVRERRSPNTDPRPDGAEIDMLILHYTGMQSAAAAIERLCDPDPPTGVRVSSHYVVEEDGTIWRLVPESLRARHAGVSHWRGRAGLNDSSIGIEIVNPGHEWGYCDFPPAQMAAVRDLCRDILARHPIPARNVVGHADVAPDRKQDPGERFPWRWLAEQGVGLWPADEGVAAGGDLAAQLMGIGYRVPAPDDPAALADVVRAFQRHWRPDAVTGTADAGTKARIAALAGMLGG